MGCTGCFSFSNSDEKKIEKKSELSFPKDPTAWSTQSLLLSVTLPSKNNLNKCLTEIAFLSNDTNNEIAILDAKTKLVENVTKSLGLYHWCFFYNMRQVDTDLESSGSNLKLKTDYFLDKMKQLWILSKALDDVSQKDRYFKYLQIRYLDLSQKYFGRHLNVVSKPFDARSAPPSEKK